ncbi:pseudouridine synthase [Ciceribacter thiooxidans]|uniref:Pseudouridine synthase n=1 Tax=Ciceribacter thiooxidans TaxID=1969821 RepID=A0ABV7HVA1_9HYPH|nr:pseudouridine synthase [Ciceribacter thiooxidans]
MTSKDKPKRPGAKSSERGAKPSPRKFARSAEKGAPKSAEKAGPKAPAKASKPAPVVTAAAAEAVVPERISKLLARAGVASRRDVERMIMEGRVSLNGKVLDTPVVNATFADQIEVDGLPIRGIERTRLWLYHKPAGLVTTNSDPEGRPTVFENLPDDLPRVMSIGRLDINTEGLLLLTNDGGLARVLELPTTGWLRRYRVRAHGDIDQDRLDKLKEGIAVEGVLYGGIDATLDRKQGHNVWLTMGLREGKNREIKNVLGALGLEVNRLIRISYGPFQLGDLPEGQVQEVRGRMLRDQLGPRLIEDAKANFDAPIYSRDRDEDEGEAVAEKPSEKPQRGKREKPEDRRERALDRLDTRRSGPAPKGGRGDRREDGDFADRPKRKPMGQSRTANVWMAPGARPLGEKAAARKAASGTGKPGRPRFEEAPRGGKPAFGQPDARSRVTISKTRDEEGEWIRAEAPPRRKDEDEGFGGRRGAGGRPDRGDRPREGRSSEGRSFEDRPRRDRPQEARDRSDRPRGDRPYGDRPRSGEKPAGDKPFSGKPERKGGKSFGGKGFGGKSFGGKAGGGKPAGGSDKPRGGRPGDGKSFGGKPSGGGRGPSKGRR